MSEQTHRTEVTAMNRGPRPPDDEISLAEVAAVLLKGRRTIVGLTMSFAVVGFLFGILSAKKYRATAEFVPQAGASQLSSLASLAGQFGIQVPTGQESEGPDFYQKLLTSRAVLAPVVSAKYKVGVEGAGGDSVSLLDLVKIAGATPQVRVARGIKWLRDQALSTSVDAQTSIVTVSVSTRWPEISYQIAAALLQQVQDFDLETRRTQAQAEREFLEGRVAAARKDLRSAEGDLQTFLQNNRQFANSPELVFQHDRLQRQVTMRQDLYTSLSQSYEQARIQEVQNTPVITILERPIVPPLREPRRTVLKTLLGLILGAMIGVGVVVARHAFDDQRGPETVALKDAWADTKQDVRRLAPWKRRA